MLMDIDKTQKLLMSSVFLHTKMGKIEFIKKIRRTLATGLAITVAAASI